MISEKRSIVGSIVFAMTTLTLLTLSGLTLYNWLKYQRDRNWDFKLVIATNGFYVVLGLIGLGALVKPYRGSLRTVALSVVILSFVCSAASVFMDFRTGTLWSTRWLVMLIHPLWALAFWLGYDSPIAKLLLPFHVSE